LWLAKEPASTEEAVELVDVETDVKPFPPSASELLFAEVE
jgi:hypothetical protein